MALISLPQAAADAAPARAAGKPRRRVPSGRQTGMALLVGVWALPVTHATGGRQGFALSLGLLSALAAMLLARPWRSMSTPHLLIPFAPALAGVVVCLTSPTAWDGADEVATAAYAAAGYVVTRACTRSAPERGVLLTVIALIGLEQFTQAYLPWWGGGDVTRKMVGTFYWHNQFAAFLVAAGLVALVLAARGSGAPRLAGWLTAPWCIAGLLFSASRASIALALFLWLLLVYAALRDRMGRVATVLVVVLGAALAWLLGSPLLMSQSGAPTATVAARQAEQSVQGNGTARLYLWRAAAETGALRPLTGLGFDTFGGAGAARMPAWATPSTFAHNGYLQAWNDGGALLAGGLLVATGPVIWWAWLAWLRRRRWEPTALAAPVAMTALLLHSGVDFDWAYPSLAVMFGLLAGLVPQPSMGPAASNRRLTVTAVVLGVVVLSMPLAARATVVKAPGVDRPWWTPALTLGLPLDGRVAWLPTGTQCRRDLLAADRAQIHDGLACTRALAEIDPGLAMDRAQALVRLGDSDRGLQMARQQIQDHATERPLLRAEYAQLLAESGKRRQAVSVVVRLRSDLQRQGLLTADREAYLTGLVKALQVPPGGPDVDN